MLARCARCLHASGKNCLTYRVADTEEVLIENHARLARASSLRLSLRRRRRRQMLLKLVGKDLLELLVANEGGSAWRRDTSGQHWLGRWCDRDGRGGLLVGVLLGARHCW